jgi:hypothetical protein
MTRKQIAAHKKQTGRSKTAKNHGRNPIPLNQTPCAGSTKSATSALQRQATAQPGFNPLDPAAMRATAQNVSGEAPVRT